MSKYTELSDFEINKKVAYLIGATPFPFGSTDYRRSAVSGCESAIIIRSPRKVGSFDPCNNPTDAMPIIIENKIAMNPKDNVWQCGSGWNVAENKNPYRAAMELFLLIKDAESNR
ncbi:DUF2591 family protein [Proteus faecis]|uniref:DUF2591 family protein n=1 Tax=Proteus faecis TaxID=2050967 RepID=A0AAW7CVB9_9GAMM|nr:phage protein NinX family protein [Proteus faecis]MDL5165770.1 DUF2591 family protein [Proteus faecis]MDL5273966.1 DUF2591 family protein [Proteus faecis]MDL5277536.1 DUF2591 family protein [Proteus faecis]MDL5306525.1 DUF2591 family protein [Proteus faecis]MDL5310094.1 DUF2591 family protein [Proteus faecis]